MCFVIVGAFMVLNHFFFHIHFTELEGWLIVVICFLGNFILFLDDRIKKLVREIDRLRPQ